MKIMVSAFLLLSLVGVAGAAEPPPAAIDFKAAAQALLLAALRDAASRGELVVWTDGCRYRFVEPDRLRFHSCTIGGKR